MIKGVFVGFAIMIVLALVPIVHIIGIPFGPFIGGYYGISATSGNQDPPGKKALMFCLWTGGLMFVVLATSAAIVTKVTDIQLLLLWGGVWVFTFYYGTMAGLGAWYAEIKAKG
ncbi:MAG: hypothetical protein O3A93_13560 [Chloroflexi bacterium]|nr:hypothetical protein [Chloroflexota bacterium]MDA1272259.1 hypothetical protein [Chloroflexota bacterium]PKB58849.1 MAG: hypothetical protein BZY83_04935 [SAR202 cluster bacterium Casp-Chloro-G2]